MDEPTIIIPMVSDKWRLKLHITTIAEKQLQQIRKVFPNNEIIIVTNPEKLDFINSIRQKNITVVENHNTSSNVAHSIFLGIMEASPNSVLLIYDDIVFNKETIMGLTTDSSYVIIDNLKQIANNKVGVTVVDNKATIFSYGLPTKWAKIVHLSKNELNILKNICTTSNVGHLFVFELLNLIINAGGTIGAIEKSEMKIVEINVNKDINKARKI